MGGDPNEIAKLTGEFIGTFLLIFTVGCNVLSGNAVWGGVSIASVLMVAIYALGGISGGNFNPAVSVCLAVTNSMGGPGGMEWGTAMKYSAVQLAAGFVAGLSYCALFWDSFNLAPAKGFGILEAGLVEMLYTFMLCFVVLNAAVAKQTQYYGLAIGFVVVAGAYGAGAISGGCFNPAVAFGIDTSSALLGFGWCLVYIVFELIGACLAAIMFKLVRPDQFGGEPTIVTRLISEFIGTFFLVLTVGLNVLGKSQAAAFSIAASLMCMIYALGDVSGAHFNPAVTLAILTCGRDKITPADAGAYMGAQVAGGISAGFTYKLLHGGASFALQPIGAYTWGQAGVAEIIFTFVLCFVVLSVAISEKTAAPEFFGLAIGSCVTVGGFAIGGVSGGSLNPAVSLGISCSHLGAVWTGIVYALFEFTGAFVASTAFKTTHAVDVDKESDKVAA
jgi:aquaporin Z